MVAKKMAEEQGEGRTTYISHIVPFSTIWSVHEIIHLPPDVRQKLTKWKKEERRNVETVISKKDAEILALKSQLKALQNEVAKTRNSDGKEERCQELVEKVFEVKKLYIEQSSVNKLKVEKACNEREAAIRERDETARINTEKTDEINRMTVSIQSLTNQLKAATMAEDNLITNLDDLKEIEKEKQLERQMQWSTIQQLTDELDKKDEELLAIQRESSERYLELQVVLSDKEEKIRRTELELENTERANETYEKHIEDLLSKQVKEVDEMEAKMQEKLVAQAKTVELHREFSRKASRRIKEQEETIASLQDLLKNVSVKYEETEKNIKDAWNSHQNAIVERDAEVSKIRKELQTANNFVESIQNNDVKELLRKLQTQNIQMDALKAKNKEIIGKLEPLHTQLELASWKNERVQIDAAQFRKRFEVTERENGTLKRQLNDLAMQVRSLLKETATQRGNYNAANRFVGDIGNMSGFQSPAHKVVTDQLVVFRNIEELQQKNQQLLAVVRNLTDKSEAQEKALQLLNIEEPSEQVLEIQEQIQSVQATCKSLQEECEAYKRKQTENEKCTNEQIEKLQKDVINLGSERARLKMQVGFDEVREKIQHEKMNILKKKIGEFEEEQKKVGIATVKLEENLKLLKSELSMTKGQLTYKDVALNSMKKERDTLHDAYVKLQENFDRRKTEDGSQKLENEQRKCEDLKRTEFIARLKAIQTRPKFKALSNSTSREASILFNRPAATVNNSGKMCQGQCIRIRRNPAARQAPANSSKVSFVQSRLSHQPTCSSQKMGPAESTYKRSRESDGEPNDNSHRRHQKDSKEVNEPDPKRTKVN